MGLIPKKSTIIFTQDSPKTYMECMGKTHEKSTNNLSCEWTTQNAKQSEHCEGMVLVTPDCENCGYSCALTYYNDQFIFPNNFEECKTKQGGAVMKNSKYAPEREICSIKIFSENSDASVQTKETAKKLVDICKNKKGSVIHKDKNDNILNCKLAYSNFSLAEKKFANNFHECYEQGGESFYSWNNGWTCEINYQSENENKHFEQCIAKEGEIIQEMPGKSGLGQGCKLILTLSEEDSKISNSPHISHLYGDDSYFYYPTKDILLVYKHKKTEGNQLIAINIESKKELWKNKTKDLSEYKILTDEKNNQIIVRGHNLTAIDIETGITNWEYDMSSYPSNLDDTLTYEINGDLLIIGALLDYSGSSTYKKSRKTAINLDDGKIISNETTEKKTKFFSEVNPKMEFKNLIITNDKQAIWALDNETKKEIWKYEVYKNKTRESTWAYENSLIDTNNDTKLLLHLAQDGILYVLDPKTGDFQWGMCGINNYKFYYPNIFFQGYRKEKYNYSADDNIYSLNINNLPPREFFDLFPNNPAVYCPSVKLNPQTTNQLQQKMKR